MAEARPVVVATTHPLQKAQPYSHPAASPTLCPKGGHASCVPAVLMVVPCVLWRHQVGEEPEDEEEQQLRALQLEDLEDHGTVGAGTSGVVNKVVHLPTGRTLALKVRRPAPVSWYVDVVLKGVQTRTLSQGSAPRCGSSRGDLSAAGACQQLQEHTAAWCRLT
jgi:hypothetical protein